MDLSYVIIGPIATEKAERQKAHRTYTFRVALGATKIDIKAALRRFYDVDIESVRVMQTRPKTRSNGAIEKRHRMRKVMVTLTPESKGLDLTKFAH